MPHRFIWIPLLVFSSAAFGVDALTVDPVGNTLVTGDVTANKSLTVMGLITANSTLAVTGVVTANNDVAVGRNLTVAGTLNVSGAITANGSVTVTGALNSRGAINASTDIGVGRNLTVTGGINAGGQVSAAEVTVARTTQAVGGQVVRGDDARLVDARPANGGNASTLGGRPSLDFALASDLRFIPTGVILPYAGAAVPAGFLLCDGRAYGRVVYPTLFAVIGTQYGAGDGTTTFSVPNLQSRFPIGAGQGPGLTNRPLGSVGGEEAHVLTVSEMPSHAHQIRRNGVGSGGGPEPVFEDHWDGGLVNTSSAGGNQPHNTMPPFLVIQYIIKY